MNKQKKKRNFILQNSFYLVFLFSTFFALLFTASHYQDINPDGISYLEIAQRYKDLKIEAAINGYWSPVFSWIIIPFLLIPGKIIGIKVLQFLLFGMWIYTSYLLAQFFVSKSGSSSVAVFVFLFPQVLEMWKLITPDVLFAVFINIFIIAIISYTQKKYRQLLLLGLLTGFGSLIKAFFLPLALVFFSSIFFLKIKRFTKNEFLILICSTLILPVFWSGLLTIKYGRFIFNTSSTSTYNKFVFGKEYLFLQKPVLPLNDFTSYWTDPTDFSVVNFQLDKQIAAVKSNLLISIKFFVKNFHIGIIFFLFAFIKQKSPQFRIAQALILLWIFLYSFILVEGRYLWPIVPLFCILLVSRLNQRALLLYFTISVLFFSQAYLHDFFPDTHSLTHFELSKNITEPCTILSDSWHRGLYVSYLANCVYAGISETAVRGYDSALLQDEITKTGSNYFLAYEHDHYILDKNLILDSVVQENNKLVMLFKIIK